MTTDNAQQYFIRESDFELALTNLLQEHGWTHEVIVQPSEDDLVQNWANILYANNRDIDRLGNAPLTATEMKQVIDKVNACNTPNEVNRLINGELISVKRDNPNDRNNFGKEVYLKIFDAKEIAAGQSRYQIVRQPRFKTAHQLGGDRRGDVMLLINGMPVIHIELKRSKVDVSQATFQIKRYMHEGVFASGLFKMVQIFVAMTPEETVYFANPGKEENFKTEFQFHWADFNNEVVSDWRRVTSDLLSIPMAHQLVGFYTIADEKDNTLKVLRSYQYFAVNKISDRTHNTNWDNHQHRGGYIWHTTGSGKTMTSFKSAQLIANSGDADKVIFLMDRIELSIQSLDEYRGFAGDSDEVQDTQDTAILMSKLKSNDSSNRLIVTSIQKMSNIHPKQGIAQAEIDLIGKKRIVFIIDECHRSVFGDMLVSIKNTFPRAILFGFTGTPIFEQNAHKEITTETIFGDMLAKYTIANGIPDGNVLGFDPYMINTYHEDELREKAAFAQLGVKRIEEIENDDEKMKIYRKFTDPKQMEMAASYNDAAGEIRHGIEYYLPKDIYQQDVHHRAVVSDIVKTRETLSKNGKFHAMLATQNIPEAIAYYKLFKEVCPSMNVVAVFDNNIDNSDEGIAREDALIQMLEDYNAKYGMSFQLSTYAKYKKDVAKRLAHKTPYNTIEHDHSQQIDLLIVVTQMLTGYDSKWVNTLYVDKVMKYVDIIQSFSRTNRLFGPDKPFGTIRYYTFPYTMEQHINDALEVYANRPLGIFVDKLESNLEQINKKFLHIKDIFTAHEIENFERLPETRVDRNMFAKDFSQMTHLLEAAKLQTFTWEKKKYEFEHGDTYTYVTMLIDEETYLVLLQRYRELFERVPGGGGDDTEFDYPIDTYITETGTGTIDAEYLDAKFVKFVKKLYAGELTDTVVKELHKAFASLSAKDQRTALVIIHDIQSGDLRLEPGKTVLDYITQYQQRELRHLIMTFAEATELDSALLWNIIRRGPLEQTINEYNQFDTLKASVNPDKARNFLSLVEGKEIKPRMVMPKMDKILRDFILEPNCRVQIINKYLGREEAEDTDIADEPNNDITIPVPTKTPAASFDMDLIAAKMTDVFSTTLSQVKGQIRDFDEVIKGIFFVIEKASIPSLDGVGIYIKKALTDLFVKTPSIVEKHVAFNLLVTKFEAYLKKLYFLEKDKEVAPYKEGDDVTWKDVIHAHPCLWNLKYSSNEGQQMLFNYLMLVKDWRNAESHISPTASEAEVDAAIQVIVAMYGYATGASITELELAGYDIEKPQTTQATPVQYELYPEPVAYTMVAESVHDLPEETRKDIFKKSLNSLFGYKGSKSAFSKQRHWIAVYRVAADMGFVIEGDYGYFKDFVDSLDLNYVPVILNISSLARAIEGVYAADKADWTSEGLQGKKFSEYQDIKLCLDSFENIVNENVAKYKAKKVQS